MIGRSTRRRLATIGSAIVLSAGCAGHLVYASDAYRGTVVDSETGQPLVGAVVLAIWYREVPTAPHGPAVDYHDALEVLTDAQGEFVIPAKTHVTPIGKIRGPEFVIYYPGYGDFPHHHVRPQGEQARAAYENRYLPVELRRWRTREETMRNADFPVGLDHRVPGSKIPNLIRLINEERRRLGLQPIGTGR